MSNMQMAIAPNANDVPNFPQDAYMEGPMMTMDAAVDRPENYGLRSGWSGFMQGMMTFATNLAANFDPAFERRIRTHVLFEMPGEAERAQI
jgi:hypothetical protein